MADLDTLLSSAQGGRLIDNLAQRFGLSDAQVESAIKALAPALSFGVEKAVESPEGFEKVVACLGAAQDCCAHDHAEAAVADDAIARGNSAVLSLFGSQDNTGQILQAASQQSGVPVDILSQLMPIIASVLLSGLNKTVNEQGLGGILGQLASSGALGNILGQVLGGGAPAGQGGRSGGAAGGGLGDILGQVLGGGGPRPRGGPAADPLGGGRAPSSGRDPLETAAASGGAGGLDPAAVQEAINRIRETLQIGQGGAAASPAQGGGQSELEKILGQLLGGRKA